ncbi:predicted protein [Histoplasma capsulatum var. duboisii H88]|uniref:Predicted protein n=1 Tax=Ajellomyces capsulatus (strain H88) TaxID=544711 RepID=F0UM53_AJEC8|nr:predicted protein [Histoplasma capsulatum var. duboisii H88]
MAKSRVLLFCPQSTAHIYIIHQLNCGASPFSPLGLSVHARYFQTAASAYAISLTSAPLSTDLFHITYKVVPNPRAKCTYACIASTLRLRESVRLADMSKFGYKVYSMTPFLMRVRSPFVRTAAEHGIPNVQATATWTKSAMVSSGLPITLDVQ